MRMVRAKLRWEVLAGVSCYGRDLVEVKKDLTLMELLNGAIEEIS